MIYDSSPYFFLLFVGRTHRDTDWRLCKLKTFINWRIYRAGLHFYKYQWKTRPTGSVHRHLIDLSILQVGLEKKSDLFWAENLCQRPSHRQGRAEPWVGSDQPNSSRICFLLSTFIPLEVMGRPKPIKLGPQMRRSSICLSMLHICWATWLCPYERGHDLTKLKSKGSWAHKSRANEYARCGRLSMLIWRVGGGSHEH